MAYCKSCGAYIPDGQTACLACGYNDSEKKKTSGTSSGAAAAAAKAPEKTASGTTRNEKYKQVDSDFLKQQLEEQRRRQQANSRKWAETEYAQRQKAKEEQTRNFTSTSGRSGSDVYRTVRSTMESDDVGKVMAGLSYFSILCKAGHEPFCCRDHRGHRGQTFRHRLVRMDRKTLYDLQRRKQCSER